MTLLTLFVDSMLQFSNTSQKTSKYDKMHGNMESVRYHFIIFIVILCTNFCYLLLIVLIIAENRLNTTKVIECLSPQV